MNPPYLNHLRHTMTRWPRTGNTFGAAELFEPGGENGGVRWTPKKRTPKFSNEQSRKSAPGSNVLVQTAVNVGDAVALGDHTGSDPVDVPSVHGVTEYRETPSLLDAYTVQRAVVEPLLGQLWQTVTVYPMQRVTSSRSYTVERQAQIYSGAASVDMTQGQRVEFADSAVVSSPVTVTVPYSVALDADTRYEIEWDGPFGLIILDSMGPVFNNDNSPFWRSLSCVMRQPQTTGS